MRVFLRAMCVLIVWTGAMAMCVFVYLCVWFVCVVNSYRGGQLYIKGRWGAEERNALQDVAMAWRPDIRLPETTHSACESPLRQHVGPMLLGCGLCMGFLLGVCLYLWSVKFVCVCDLF